MWRYWLFMGVGMVWVGLLLRVDVLGVVLGGGLVGVGGVWCWPSLWMCYGTCVTLYDGVDVLACVWLVVICS